LRSGNTAIEVRGGANIQILGCEVRNSGGSGILLGGGVRDALVERTLVE
jgi:hypothetical protein